MSLALDIAIEHEAWHVVTGLDLLAQRAAAAALAIVDDAPTDAEVSLVLCDDAFIRTLNRTWRGKDQPTNVLSFPTDAATPEAGPTLLGDIVVAYETSAREAIEEGKSLPDHLAHLVVHGMFHLLGYDHEDDAEADVMEALEGRALAALGVVSPYLSDAEDTRARP